MKKPLNIRDIVYCSEKKGTTRISYCTFCLNTYEIMENLCQIRTNSKREPKIFSDSLLLHSPHKVFADDNNTYTVCSAYRQKYSWAFCNYTISLLFFQQKRENTDPASVDANHLFSLSVVILLYAGDMILSRFILKSHHLLYSVFIIFLTLIKAGLG